MPEVLSTDRATGIKRLLWVALVCGVLVAAFAVFAAVGGNTRYAITLAVGAVLLLGSAGFTLRALPGRDDRARRGALVTGVLMLLFALPAVKILIGLIMAVGGVGMLFVALSKENEA